MKTSTKILAATGFALAVLSGSAMARPFVGLSIGVPAPVYVAPPAPYYAPPPVYAAPGYAYGYAPAPVYGPSVVVGGGYYGRPYYHGYYGHPYYRGGYYHHGHR